MNNKNSSNHNKYIYQVHIQVNNNRHKDQTLTLQILKEIIINKINDLFIFLIIKYIFFIKLLYKVYICIFIQEYIIYTIIKKYIIY